MDFLNKSLSSAFEIAFIEAPINSTLYFLSIPSSESARATFRAVCPPIVGSKASGFSILIILVIISGVIGSM